MKEDKIKELVCSLCEKPSYVNEDSIMIIVEDTKIDIVLFGDFHHYIYLNEKESMNDGACCSEGCAYGKQDLLYSAAILEAREEILEIFNN